MFREPHHQNSTYILIALLLIDGLVILLHLFNALPFFETRLPWLQGSFFYLGTEHGIGETWQLAQWLALVGAFVYLTIKQSFVYMPWTVLSVYLLLDDRLELHESIGNWLAGGLGLGSFIYLRAKDFGELTVYLFIGLLFLLCLYFFYRRATVQIRKNFRFLLILIFLLALFGAVFDMGAVFTYDLTGSKLLAGLVELAEDGGELMVLSFMVWFSTVLCANQQFKSPKFFSKLLFLAR